MIIYSMFKKKKIILIEINSDTTNIIIVALLGSSLGSNILEVQPLITILASMLFSNIKENRVIETYAT